MRRKAIIVTGITFMVTVMVTAFSYLYITQILRQRITNAYESASRLTQQLAYFAENDLPDLSSTPIDTNDPAAVRRALAAYLPMDTNLLNNLESEVALWPFIYDASVVDANGKALLHTNPQLLGKQVAPRPQFYAVTTARAWEQFRLVYRPATVYDVSFPLQLNGAPFGTIHTGFRRSFSRVKSHRASCTRCISRLPRSSLLSCWLPACPISLSGRSRRSAATWIAWVRVQPRHSQETNRNTTNSDWSR